MSLPRPRSALARGLATVRTHGRALLGVAVVSVLGIVATAGFQLVAIHGLAPSQFGLLASFLALINVVSVGSAALRNSVAVGTASELLNTRQGVEVKKPRVDSTLVEALVLGVGAAAILAALSPVLADVLDSKVVAILFTAAAALPYFLFARAQGRLQGAGNSNAVVWWSTGAQLGQLVLALIAIALGFGAVGIVAVLLIVAVVGTLGASIQSKRLPAISSLRPFSRASSVVLLLTVAFAWLTNADVILVRSGASSDVAGAYAAAGVIVKTILIVPATLSLYLLPRFVGRRDDAGMTRFGVNLSLGITLTCGIALFLGVLLLGPWLISILYPGDYSQAAALLPWLALMWLPWAAAQSVLIRTTAAASYGGLAVLIGAVLAQWTLVSLVLPNVYVMMAVNGLVGLLALAGLFLLHLRASRPAA